MEQFLFVPASVYNNKNLDTLAVTKQEFPKYQVDPNPTYKVDSLKREIRKNLFPNADSWFDKILSSYQALKFADFIIGCYGNRSFTVWLCSTNSL